jgi:hypothetical protein
MAAVALLLVVLGLYRMDADPVAAMALGMRIAPKVLFFQIGAVQQATLVAIKTPGLIVALGAVVADLAGKYAMFPRKIGIMVGCYPFALVAGVALTDLHFGVFGVGLFFVGVGLLLQADKPKAKYCNNEYNSFHVCPPFLKVVVEGHAPGPVFLVAGIHVVLNPDGRRHFVVDLVLASQPVLAGGFLSG